MTRPKAGPQPRLISEPKPQAAFLFLIVAHPASAQSEPAGNEPVLALVDAGAPAWVLARGPRDGRGSFTHWLLQRRSLAIATPVVRSEELPEVRGWPGQVTLYLLETPTPQWYPAPQMMRFLRSAPRDGHRPIEP